MADRVVTYSQAHSILYNWLVDGDLEFDGTKAPNQYAEFDKFLLDLFGYFSENNHRENVHKAACAFDDDLLSGKLNVDWLAGPHGLTLFKLKMAQATKGSDNAV